MKNDIQEIEKIKELLLKTIQEVERALKDWPEAQFSFSSGQELVFINIKLKEMLHSLEEGKKIPVPGLWRIVIDTWPYTNNLRQKIVETELKYDRLKCFKNI